MEKEFEKALKEFEKFLKEMNSEKANKNDMKKDIENLKKSINEGLDHMENCVICVIDNKANVYGSSSEIMNALGGLIDGILTNTDIDKDMMRKFLNYVIDQSE